VYIKNLGSAICFRAGLLINHPFPPTLLQRSAIEIIDTVPDFLTSTMDSSSPPPVVWPDIHGLTLAPHRSAVAGHPSMPPQPAGQYYQSQNYVITLNTDKEPITYILRRSV
jgi:hypothetical protein